MSKYPDPDDLPGDDINVYTDVPYDDGLFTIEDNNGNKQDPSSWTLELSVVNIGTDTLDSTYTRTGGGLYVDGDSVIHIDWSDSDTDAFDPDKLYHYFLAADDGTNDKEITHGGRMFVHDNIP